MTEFVLGNDQDGADFEADVARIVGNRMLIQANSGGGKSYAIRRILEQTYGQVQHIVVDPEGEFSTLREQYDYLLVGHDADVFVPVRRANFYARKLLELRVSTIVDISEFEVAERQAFVDNFLSGLINAPYKGKNRAVLVVLDEAHMFCPEGGKSESGRAVIDLVTRGRKRGLGSIMATQRISKFNKNAAAELQNILIGLTNLDIDMKRAADVLGLPPAQARTELRSLVPGEFYCYGPALERGVHRIKIGAVTTTHPEAGTAMMAPSLEPTEGIRKVLAQFAEAEHEAERDATNFEDAQKLIATLKRDNSRLKRQGGGVNEREVERQVNGVRREALREQKAAATAQNQELARVRREAEAALRAERVNQRALRTKAVSAHKKVRAAALELGAALDVESALPPVVIATSPTNHRDPSPDLAVMPASLRRSSSNGEVKLKKGARKMLGVLVSHHPALWTKSQWATLSGLKSTSGTFSSYVSTLRGLGYLVEDNRLFGASDAALDALDVVPETPQTHDEMMAMWLPRLKGGARRMLQAAVDTYDGISRIDLGAEVDMSAASGTFSSYLSVLRTNGLIEERGGQIYPAPILWPEEAATL